MQHQAALPHRKREQKQYIQAMRPEGFAKIAEPGAEVKHQRDCRGAAYEERPGLLVSNAAAGPQIDDTRGDEGTSGYDLKPGLRTGENADSEREAAYAHEQAERHGHTGGDG